LPRGPEDEELELKSTLAVAEEDEDVGRFSIERLELLEDEELVRIVDCVYDSVDDVSDELELGSSVVLGVGVGVKHVTREKNGELRDWSLKVSYTTGFAGRHESGYFGSNIWC
jgi:hypothetical protein